MKRESMKKVHLATVVLVFLPGSTLLAPPAATAQNADWR